MKSTSLVQRTKIKHFKLSINLEVNRIFKISQLIELGKSLKSILDHELISPVMGVLYEQPKLYGRAVLSSSSVWKLDPNQKSNRLSVMQHKLCNCVGF